MNFCQRCGTSYPSNTSHSCAVNPYYPPGAEPLTTLRAEEGNSALRSALAQAREEVERLCEQRRNLCHNIDLQAARATRAEAEVERLREALTEIEALAEKGMEVFMQPYFDLFDQIHSLSIRAAVEEGP
jgi:hypothetical protein